MSMFLRMQGIDSVIIEKATFPRYHIGESLTGECGGVLRDLGLEPEMMRRKYPVKHGVKVYGNSNTYWWVPVAMRTPEWELKDQFTWQVRRADFDKMLLDEAVKRGATLIQGKATKPLVRDDGSVRGVEVRLSDGGLMEIESDLLIDATGLNTWLASTDTVTGPKYLGSYDKQIAIFSQVEGAIRDSGTSREEQKDNTIIYYKKKFHWSWFIPIDDEVVSVAVNVPAATFKDSGLSRKEFLAKELTSLHPDLTRRITSTDFVEDVHAINNYSYQVKGFTGRGYICLGDAHRFIDPIFSFGLYISMKEAYYLAPIVKEYLDGKNRDAAQPFRDWAIFAEKAIDVLEDVLDCFWEQPFAFAQFVHARYRPLMMDVFAGRVFERQPSVAVDAFRRLLKRDRSYESEDVYSVPIGSRFHEERAPLWNDTGTIELPWERF
jgi:1H-pyrrole-2-carbonyl-[peptidyl-carrier protein] brominase